MTSQDGPWHAIDAGAALARAGTNAESGLATGEVARRQLRDGANELKEGRQRSLPGMLVGQFRDFMIIVLLAAALVSGIVGDLQDAIAIVIIVLINALIGTVQEYRAQKAILALRQMAAPMARVRRDGALLQIAARDLVVGDIVLLEAGNVVPADIRILSDSQIEMDESALTGESATVSKSPVAVGEADVPIGDRTCMGFKGTIVTRGQGCGLVVAIGMDTELGRIATLLQDDEDDTTPLQRRLARFGRRLALAVLGICALLFAFGLLRGEPPVLMFLTAVGLAVAAIPEALPAVVTIALAFGARNMSRRKALLRRLPAVETLGSVTYICADKTGTLTENQMRVECFLVDGQRHDQPPEDWRDDATWLWLLRALALNNDIQTRADGEPLGEPTELALFVAARDAGCDRNEAQSKLPRQAELAFESERKRMSTLHRDKENWVVLTKGAPETLLSRCAHHLRGGKQQTLDVDAEIRRANDLAAEGYRVIAVACAQHNTEPCPFSEETAEHDLTLLGLVALIDPPREAAFAAVRECRSAGITPVMITGDHPGTAMAIARRLGIAGEGDRAISGREFARLSNAEIQEMLPSMRVYARMDPAQKIRIVRGLQERGEFVAMTGDGVNDAPALRRADIGVAMGIKGTDVARETADMVLLDDNFSTIVAAVREGRRVYDNLRKFLKYTMTSNLGEILTLVIAPLLGLPLPLLPIQILWINIVTDGLPGLAFAAEPEERGLMRRPPRDPRESVFARGVWQHMLWAGSLIAGLSIGTQAWAYGSGSQAWQTCVFTMLALCQMVHVIAIRSDSESIIARGLLTNLPMLAAVTATLALQIAAIYLPFFNEVLKTQPLNATELTVCLLLPLTMLIAVEIEKALVRRRLLYAGA